MNACLFQQQSYNLYVNISLLSYIISSHHFISISLRSIVNYKERHVRERKEFFFSSQWVSYI